MKPTASEGFSRLWPSVVVVVSYAAAFCFLSLTLETIPVGVAYTIRSGVGVALIALMARVLQGRSLDFPAVAGIVLVVAGVIVLNPFSKSVSHPS